MMFKKNLVAAIKVGGRVLRESSGRVELPFGSEYSILLKNMDSVRVQAKITIDNREVSDGWFVLGPNSNTEIERFVKNFDRGNRFKFIERTEQIEQHRGIRLEDGLIRIEFRREKVYEAPKIHYTFHYDWYQPHLYEKSLVTRCYPTASYNGTTINNASTVVTASMGAGASSSVCNAFKAENEAGITVEGSLSNQKFVSVGGFETENSEVLVLQLVGRKAGETVQVVRTVQTKLTCDTCGRKNKSLNKFCTECGTSLERV